MARFARFATIRGNGHPADHPARRAHPLAQATSIPTRSRFSTGLRQFDHVAYLVGGSVRDLLLGRRPKDFDIGTSAHPYQVKRLFRNCWIIGRRFRLAHVKFGTKTIEVATFRRQVRGGARGDGGGGAALEDGVDASAGARCESAGRCDVDRARADRDRS